MYFIGRHLAGVCPTAPGYSFYTVSPLCGLCDFDVTVPTVNGTIRVCVSKKKLTVCSTLLGGTLRIAEKEIPIPCGKAVILIFDSESDC